MIIRTLPLAAASAVFALVLAAPASAGSPPAPKPDGQWKSPQEAWDKTCSRCHLTGVGPELRGRDIPPEYIRTVVRNGMRAMPAFPHSALGDATLDGVARLVSTSKLPKPVGKR